MSKKNNSKLRVDNLIIETTRRCNFSCEHCLRGDAQSIDIENLRIYELLYQIKYIGELTITGGEPTMNASALKVIVDAIKRNNIEISRFYVVSNCEYESLEFLSEVIKLYSLCEDKEECSFDKSIDNYHNVYSTKNFTIYEALSFYKERKNTYTEKNTLYMGKAKDNSLGYRELYEPEISEDDYYINKDNSLELYSGIELYLNAKGNILFGCDYSYEEQEERIICRSADNITEKIKEYLGINNG